jgi:hypothetical protein
MGATGHRSVAGRSKGGAVLAVLTAALLIGGCSDNTQTWFPKPANMFGSNNYTYSSLGQARLDRPVAAGDLVDANGGCPNYAVPAAGPSANPAEGQPVDAAALLGGGIALGMSECEVVARLGQPTAVNLGTNPNGLRGVTLSYNAGPRPGVYRFEAGRLAEMDRVEGPPSAPAPAKKTTRKKPAKPADSPDPSKS